MRVRRTVGLGALLAVGFILTSVQAEAATKKRITTPGSNKSFSWVRKGINECRAAGKPILLYIYDNKIPGKRNNTALHYENNVFPDKNVISAVSGYTTVMLGMSTMRGWPPALFLGAHKGAAVYLMTCDGQAYGKWTSTSRPNKKQFATIANQVKAVNPAAKERMAKNPPKKFVDPKRPEPVDNMARQEEEERKPKTAGNIPGLGGDDDDDKKGKKKPPKRPRPVEEEEEEEE